MKKVLVILCVSVLSVAASAQVVSQNGKSVRKLHIQKEKRIESSSSVAKEISNFRKGQFSNRIEIKRPIAMDHMDLLVERQVARVQVQQPQSSWPQTDEHEVPVKPVVSDKPSYYAQEEAYQLCNAVEVCKTWVQEQAAKDAHFLVLFADLSMKPDGHNQHLEVRYIMGAEEEIKVFEEDFGIWK